MYMAVWGVLPHSNSIFYRIFVNYTSDFRHFPKNRRFAFGGGWQNGAFVHFAVGVCRFGRRLDLPPLYPAGGVPALPPPYPALSLLSCPPIPPALARRALFPGGEGGDQGYFMQGAPPLASLGLNPSGAGSRGEPLARRGSAPGWSPARPAAAVPGGGRACFAASLPRH